MDPLFAWMYTERKAHLVDSKCMHMKPIWAWAIKQLGSMLACHHGQLVIPSTSAHVVLSTEEGAQGTMWILMLNLAAAIKSKTGKVASTIHHSNLILGRNIQFIVDLFDIV
jgi:hypothetical protein